MKKLLKVKLIGENINKEFELPSLQNVDAMIFAWLQLDCSIEFFVEVKND